MVKFAGNALQITNSIIVTVLERSGIDLIENSILPPIFIGFNDWGALHKAGDPQNYESSHKY